ncbi:fructokinase [Streptohalobacillus salinus]|uniref:Fructokinase n=1 Tax=Streptohalobacillus salinus TaxID=621096 RepID=A0A2V3W9C5_9BACI|nr:carbohydrate kinase [Streptohalobacillus salinus]PXW90977.1 fructokinase [Streptohalobacillus salinus]
MQSKDMFYFNYKKIDVLAIGEILIDMISDSYEGLTKNNQFHAYYGGSPANLAMNVSRLGGHSQLCAAVGNDRFGDFLIDHLKKQQLDTSLMQRATLPTSMVVINKSKGTPVPTFYRGADHQFLMTDQLKLAIQNTKIVHFSSWPMSNRDARRLVYEVIVEARDAGALIGFDPNYHPGLWQDDEDGIAIIKDMIGRVDVIKPSEDDAERIFGPDTVENQIDKFHALGCPFVMMTIGAKGAVISQNGEKNYYQSKAKTVVDTTGAGDAFWSGFYTGITQDETVHESIELGLLTSAFKLAHMGAIADLPHYTLLQTMMTERL